MYGLDNPSVKNMLIIEKLFRRYLRNLSDEEKTNLIKHILNTMSDIEKKKVEEELNSMSTEEIAEALSEGDDVEN